jgi:hypothetical protein
MHRMDEMQLLGSLVAACVADAAAAAGATSAAAEAPADRPLPADAALLQQAVAALCRAAELVADAAVDPSPHFSFEVDQLDIMIGALLHVCGTFADGSGGGDGAEDEERAGRPPPPQHLTALAAQAAAALRLLADAATAAGGAGRFVAAAGAEGRPAGIGGSVLEQWLSGSLRVRTGIAEEAATPQQQQQQLQQHAAHGASPQSGGAGATSGQSSRSASRRVTFNPADLNSDDEEEGEEGHSQALDWEAEGAEREDGGEAEQGRRRSLQRSGSSGKRTAADLLRSGGSSRARRGSRGELVLSPNGKEMAVPGILMWQQAEGEGGEAAAAAAAEEGEQPVQPRHCEQQEQGALEEQQQQEHQQHSREPLLAAWQRHCATLTAVAMSSASAAAAAACASAVDAEAEAVAFDAPFAHQLHLLRSISPGPSCGGSPPALAASHQLHAAPDSTAAAGLLSTRGSGAAFASAGGARSSVGGIAAVSGVAPTLPVSPRRRGLRYCRPAGSPPYGGHGASTSFGGTGGRRGMSHCAAAEVDGNQMEAAVQLLEALAALGRDER